MTASTEEWPPYHVGTRDHLHAIGVLIANWNQVETAYQALMQLIFPHHLKSGIRVFQLFTNDQRVKLIRDELVASLSAEEADRVNHFLAMANICYANRNAFAHAQAHQTAHDDKFRISKGTGKENIGAQYLFKLDDLREIADATHGTFMFCLNIFAHIQIKSTIIDLARSGNDFSWCPLMPLPEKPSLPRSWDQIREIPIPHPPPPQSSEE
jgi:hypothetical protein